VSKKHFLNDSFVRFDDREGKDEVQVQIQNFVNICGKFFFVTLLKKLCHEFTRNFCDLPHYLLCILLLAQSSDKTLLSLGKLFEGRAVKKRGQKSSLRGLASKNVEKTYFNTFFFFFLGELPSLSLSLDLSTRVNIWFKSSFGRKETPSISLSPPLSLSFRWMKIYLAFILSGLEAHFALTLMRPC